jgi:hypothetical protein
VPQLDDRLDSPSMRRFVDTPVLNRPNAVISWNANLGEGVPGTPAVSAYAAPARATDLTGLPPAFPVAYLPPEIYATLRDEGAYLASVPTRYRTRGRYPSWSRRRVR